MLCVQIITARANTGKNFRYAKMTKTRSRASVGGEKVPLNLPRWFNFSKWWSLFIQITSSKFMN